MYRMCDIEEGEVETMGCGCYGGGIRPRSFLTKEERLELLKEYKADLEKEAQGIEERIKEIEAK